MKTWTERSATRKALGELERVVQYLTDHVAAPRLAGPADRRWFQFPDQGPLELILVKAARVVSCLNALPNLLEQGFSVEAASLMRTLDDFLDEITFVLEATQAQEMTVAQKDFIRHFFDETVESTEEALAGKRQPNRAKRKDVRAAQGRFVGQGNPTQVQKVVAAIDRGWDGYIHGGYPHSMELYRGNKRWVLNGDVNSPYIQSLWNHYGHYVSRALSAVAFVVLLTGNESYKEELVAARKRFEESGDFPDGGV